MSFDIGHYSTQSSVDALAVAVPYVLVRLSKHVFLRRK